MKLRTSIDFFSEKAWQQAKFLASAPSFKCCIPEGPLPEIAFVGRSNAGKSSLINALARRKGLAKSSSTPGKTQAMNFFSVGDLCILVDMPGYGFAKVPKEIREQWNVEIDLYFTKRSTLQAAILVLDIRREPSAEDVQCALFCLHKGIPLLCVFTKGDLVKEPLLSAKRAMEALGDLPYAVHSEGDPYARKHVLMRLKELWD